MTRARWTLIVWAVTMTMGVAGITLLLFNGGDDFTPHSVVSLGFGSVGALISRRRPHRIGLLFLGFGAFAAFTGLLIQGCEAFDPTGAKLAWVCGDGSNVASALWPASYLFFGSLFLLFPTGTLPSRRWWPAAGVFYTSWGVSMISGLLMGDLWIERNFGFVITIAVWALATVALAPLFRIRKAGPVERQQLRWLAYVIGITMLLLALGVLFDLTGQRALLEVVTLVMFANVVLGVPATITIAILRYRLYEIDAIVNRTLVYVALTALLALAYLGSVVVLQRLLDPVTADSDLAIAGSTLAVAALFGPVRRRVQSFIDHRFYRRKYDAAETLTGFTTRLRDQVDLDALSRDLVRVVGTTMQPAHASLWLRPGGQS